MKYKNQDFEISLSTTEPEGWINHFKMDGDGCMANMPKILEFKTRVEQTLDELITKQELPAIAKKMGEANPEVFGQPEILPRMEKASLVFPHILEIMQEGFHPEVVLGMLRLTVGDVAFGHNFKFLSKFENLRDDKSLRQEVWGIVDHVSIYVALSVFADIITGIDINNPTDEEFQKSTCYETATRFKPHF